MAGHLKYEERKKYLQAIKKEVAMYNKIASERYSSTKNKSLMMSNDILDERNSVMRVVDVERMKRTNLNEFKRHEMERIMAQRLADDEEQQRASRKIVADSGEDLTKTQLIDRYNRQNFKKYLESLCLRSTRSIVDDDAKGYQIIAF